MRTIIALTLSAAALAGVSSGAAAQGLQYDCRNEPVRVEIPGGRLDRALAQLRATTRCPISGTQLARGKKSKPLVGTMVPEQALQAMLNNTGLESRKIKGGFQVVRTER